ncbi:hypothetical protein LIER_29960 [Lithospermum erythrorhizon]|uniref:Gag-pol polyprotein n=1 Tax=Lithospermum erythrorhizon TaxID=34254 RepID=A0AAV3RPL0_LITER
MSNEKLVKKVLRTLPKRFAHKVTTIEEGHDLTTMGIDQLIGNLTTFEMMFESIESNKKKGISLQKSMTNGLTRDGRTQNLEDQTVVLINKAKEEGYSTKNVKVLDTYK